MTATNPFLVPDPRGGEPILEMKLGLTLYRATAPNPATARAAYDVLMAAYGSRVRLYCATTPGAVPLPWTPGARAELERVRLPRLRTLQAWGYGFSSGPGADQTLFMIHGSRPVSEAGKASFVRLDVPWDTDPQQLLDVARQLADAIGFLWGVGGLYFQKNSAQHLPSMNEMYALARRYWGVAAHNLDATLWHALDGITCVQWLTLLGHDFAARHPDALATARASCFAAEDRAHGTLLLLEDRLRTIDRHAMDPLGAYEPVAKALQPFQVTSHVSFGGTRWTDDDTYAYLTRFSTGTV